MKGKAAPGARRPQGPRIPLAAPRAGGFGAPAILGLPRGLPGFAGGPSQGKG